MNIKQLHTLLLFVVCAALAACTDDQYNPFSPDPNNGKTPIELSIGGVDAQGVTRAVITDGTTNTSFGRDTKVFILMQSDKDVTTHEGYEYKGDRASTLYAVARGDVNASDPTKLIFDDINKKYWDDAHARSTQLTLWAFAQRIATDQDRTWKTCYFQSYDGQNPSREESKKLGFNTATTSYNFKAAADNYPAIYPAIYDFSVGNPTQDKNTLIYQDILFSNNIANYVGNTKVPEASRKDNRLKFDFGTHKFPETKELKFYHGMSKITIQIKAGEGFKADGTDFQLKKNSTNVQTIDLLSGLNTRGLFNIKDGEFQMIHDRSDITSIPLTKTVQGKDEPYYTLEALAVPNIHQFLNDYSESDPGSRFDDGSETVMIQFTIDNNTYKIKSGVLYDALKNLTVGDGTNQIHKYTDNVNYIPMEAGKNYVFTFTIGMQKIENISATLADWITVTATEQTPSNAYVTVSVKTSEGTAVTGSPSFDLYRAPGTTYSGTATSDGYNAYADYNWEKSYAKSTSLSEKTTGTYTTEWYWPDNNTFYHFRSISPTSESIEGNSATTYINMTGGVIKEGSVTAKDYVWGAPFKTDSPSPDNYSFTSGYCYNATKENGQLYKAIGATTEKITLIQHHMTSQVYVDLETTASPATDMVDLTNATVELTNLAPKAKLYLGNGLVTEYSNFGDVTMTADTHAAASPIPAYDYSYGVLPQQLSNSNGTGKVGIKITTTDGNVYIIDDIKTIKVGSNAITEWLPGRKYYYKFTLKKSGITDITATIVDWETVTADDEDVQIK